MATNLNVAVKNIRNGTARLPEITDAVANGTKDLPGLVRQTQISMREIERLVEAMQRTLAPAQIRELDESAALAAAARRRGAENEAGECVPFAQGFGEVMFEAMGAAEGDDLHFNPACEISIHRLPTHALPRVEPS